MDRIASVCGWTLAGRWLKDRRGSTKRLARVNDVGTVQLGLDYHRWAPDYRRVKYAMVLSIFPHFSTSQPFASVDTLVFHYDPLHD